MPDYKKIFLRPHTFLVVIHAQNPDQALENARIAHQEGADGIFLINHGVPSGVLLSCYKEVRDYYPEWWIGLNFLDQPSNVAAINRTPLDASGLWVDDAKIREGETDPVDIASMSLDMRLMKQTSWRALYFGGVAFKGRAPVKDLTYVASLAKEFVDVVTTSGPETGFPPTVGKIQTIRKAIGTHPLAIASGIREGNVRSFLEFADCFLVATGISYSFTRLDEVKVRRLAKIIHES
ncbi:MAG TPA: hypothetical protein VHZ04_02485 [Candidatus Paceibacterota bacterium]|nr:hypothetical protein [Candidatus Paceibacterota bacterium]